MAKPRWLEIAESYIGTREVPGKGSNPVIVGWLIALKAWWREDLTPWCGVFCAECMRQAGIARPKAWYRALAWLDWGVKLDKPLLGCVAVLERKGGGHVFFVAGVSGDKILGLGGNQSDTVRYAVFEAKDIKGYRWPAGVEFAEPAPKVNLALFLQEKVRMN